LILTREPAVLSRVSLAPTETLDTWAIVSITVDHCLDLVAEPCPSRMLDNPYARLDADVRSQLRIDLRRMWSPHPRLVVERSRGRWIGIRGQLSRPCTLGRPDIAGATMIMEAR
jgi:hypothetical protein